MWHTGTLDPLATGCLLVATNNYTKLIPYFEKDTKEYECSIFLDGVSDSFDIDTPVTYLSTQKQKYFSETITEKQIQEILNTRFTWTIIQIPPAYSALKIWGKKAVDLVREWKTPEMKSREVTISKIEILDFSYPRLSLRMTVSAGTYIRSIAKDLWDVLGTGWYIETLRRTKIGGISLTKAVRLEYIAPNDCLSEEYIFPSSRFVVLDDEDMLSRLANGQRIRHDFSFPEGQDLFLKKHSKIQYILRYEQGLLTSLKKIF